MHDLLGRKRRILEHPGHQFPSTGLADVQDQIHPRSVGEDQLTPEVQGRLSQLAFRDLGCAGRGVP